MKSVPPYLEQLSKNDLIKTIQTLQKNQHLSQQDLKRLIKEQADILLPLGIFVKELSALESICKYLKEHLGLSYHTIAKLLQRNDRTIWTTYRNACKKKKERFIIGKTSLHIPLHLFAERTLSVLETLVTYLKEQHDLSYKEIGKLLHRNERTTWTVYQRGKKKQ